MSSQLAPDSALAGVVDRLQSGGSLAPGQHAVKLARSLHSGRIAVALREAIVSGALPAGQSLVETRLADALSVSRGPIRSALNALEGEGLVETKRNGRMVVVGFSSDDVRDLFDVRFWLESRAISLGLERNCPIDPINDAFDELAREGNSTPRLVDLDIAFHRSLLQFSTSRFLERAWLALAPLIHAVITIGNSRLVEQDPQSNFVRIVESHRVLVNALSEREEDAAIQMLARQFELSKSMFGAADTARSSG